MTAVTGETGAGKTLLVDAIELLVGGRAEASVVRGGAAEATVEGRFVVGDEEVVVRRVVSAQGRSRAYLDGAMATVSELAAAGESLVDLHGQHAHQSLLGAAAQRAALDAFGHVDLTALRAAREARVDLEARLAALGGDPRDRAREIDLLAYQVDEIDNAALDDPDEDAQLAAAEETLANAAAHREAAAVAYASLLDDDAAADQLRAAASALAGRPPFASAVDRLQGVVAEVDDIARDVRSALETIDEDPEQLARVRARRQMLVELRRKYGDTIAEVQAFGAQAALRLAELRGYDDEVAVITAQLDAARAAERHAAQAVAQARRGAAAPAAEAIQANLRELALPRAEIRVDVDGEAPCDEVTFEFTANPGEAALPLRKVASGGELARVMLALRLVLTSGPPTMVFDEVDAGIGGEAAVAVGRALARLGDERQVLVVTHLPQVAAFANAQVQIAKDDVGNRVVARAVTLEDADRIVELSRMLGGDADSVAARKHAKELLASARKRRAG
jgi:DNA repair protein RecN (Recombination protein N)